MPDYSLTPSEHDESNQEVEDTSSLGDSGRESMRGFPPLADETRMGLNELNNAGADRVEMGEWATENLSHEEHENLRWCSHVDGNATSIYDAKGDEWLEFPDPTKIKSASDE